MAEAQLLAGLSFLLLASLVAAKTQQVSTLVPDRLQLDVAGDMWKCCEADEPEPQNQIA